MGSHIVVDISNYMEFEWSDEVLVARYISTEPLTLAVAEALVQARLDFCEGQDHRLVISFPKLSAIQKDAKKFLSTDLAKKHITASAMVTPTLLSKMIINFFMNLNPKDEFPKRIFDSESEALFWIKNMV